MRLQFLQKPPPPPAHSKLLASEGLVCIGNLELKWRAIGPKRKRTSAAGHLDLLPAHLLPTGFTVLHIMAFPEKSGRNSKQSLLHTFIKKGQKHLRFSLHTRFSTSGPGLQTFPHKTSPQNQPTRPLSFLRLT